MTGSNLGNRLAHLNNAIKELNDTFGASIKSSSIYESAPWGNQQQASFLNQVLVFKCSLAPRAILSGILEIETKLGRTRQQKWGARTIDIDILYYGDLIFKDSELIIPHPYIAQRRFTLVPLNEIAPDLIHPEIGFRTHDLLQSCKDPLAVKVFSEYS